MASYIGRRVLQVPILLIVTSIIVFVCLRLGPFNPTGLLTQVSSDPSEVERIRDAWGLDDPLYSQYWQYMTNAAQGDFGRAFLGNRPVMETIQERLPATIELALVGMLLGTALGLGLGIAAALKRDTATDAALRSAALSGISIPAFWLGLMMISLFSVKLGWLPAGGRLDSRVEPDTITGFYLLDSVLARNWTMLEDAVRHLVLPGILLALFVCGYVAQVVRAAMLEAFGEEYVRAARAKGLRRRTVVYRHALPNALPPIITVLGLQFGLLLGGAAVTETVFSYPGLGQLLVDSIGSQDFPLIQAVILVVVTIYIVVNLVVDVLLVAIDPRLRDRIGGRA